MIGRNLKSIIGAVIVFLAIGAASQSFSAETASVSEAPPVELLKVRPFQSIRITSNFDNNSGELKDALLGQLERMTVRMGRPNSGWVSKPFRYQVDKYLTQEGVFNSVMQVLSGVYSGQNSLLYTAPENPGEYTLYVSRGSDSFKYKIEVSETAPSIKTPETSRFHASEIITDPYFYLAERYAPFIAQETWFYPKADYLARFDYDGNWKGDDNWENLYRGSSQAFVYYSVMETETHWFLIYNFFHPRDYSDICVIGTCHENDNEGLILTVRKNNTRYGKLEVMETLAHNNVYSFSNDKSIKAGARTIDGKIYLHKGKSPMVFIEGGGHGVYGLGVRRSKKFSVKKMDFKKYSGLTYIYKGEAERPKHPSDREVGYALLPIYDDLWRKGNQETDQSNETFEKFYKYKPYGGRPGTKALFIAGAFKGRTASDGLAKPFWGWHDQKTKTKKLLNKGQWALDPAYAITKHFKFSHNKPVSTSYLHNPFLKSTK